MGTHTRVRSIESLANSLWEAFAVRFRSDKPRIESYGWFDSPESRALFDQSCDAYSAIYEYCQ
jgi:hypothetical protein